MRPLKDEKLIRTGEGMELLIKNAKLVDEAAELAADVLVRDGKIAAIGRGLDMYRRGD